MPPVEFEPTVSADERLQTYALYRASTGVDQAVFNKIKLFASRDILVHDATHLRTPASLSG
jgi:hypothetical protein